MRPYPRRASRLLPRPFGMQSDAHVAPAPVDQRIGTIFAVCGAASVAASGAYLTPAIGEAAPGAAASSVTATGTFRSTSIGVIDAQAGNATTSGGGVAIVPITATIDAQADASEVAATATFSSLSSAVIDAHAVAAAASGSGIIPRTGSAAVEAGAAQVAAAGTFVSLSTGVGAPAASAAQAAATATFRSLSSGSVAAVAAAASSAATGSSAPPEATQIGYDSFSRTAADGTSYGTPEIGGAITLNATSGVAIDGDKLVITPSAVNQARTGTYAATATDLYARKEFALSALPAGGNQSAAIVLRATSTTAQLRAKATIDSAGVFKVQGFYINGGSETSVAASVTVTRVGTVTANTKYMIAAEVEGTAFRIRAWLASQPEPGAWDWTGTQSTISGAGTFGWRTVAPSSGASPTVKIDAIDVYALDGDITPLQSYVAVASVATAMADTTNYPDGSTIIAPATVLTESWAITRDLTIAAAASALGQTILRGAASDVSATWTLDTADTYYITGVTHTVYQVSYKGRLLYDFSYPGSSGTLTNLKNATWPSGSGATGTAPGEGSFYDAAADRLYIRLLSDDGSTYLNPNTVEADLLWTRSGVDNGGSGHAITVADGVALTLRGIVLDMWPNSGILIGNNGADVTCEDVLVHNCLTAFKGTADGSTPRACTLRRTEISGRGTVGTQNGPYTLRRVLSDAFDGLYDSNLALRVTNLKGGLDAEGVYAHDLFDGFQAIGYDETDHGQQIRLYNLFCQNIVDNPIEIEPTGEFTDATVERFVFIDCVTPLGLAPYMPGPDGGPYGAVEVSYGICYTSSEYGVTTGTVALLKHTSHGSIDPAVSTQRNADMHHITALLGPVGRLVVVGDSEDFSYDAMQFRASIVQIGLSRAWAYGGRTSGSDTGYQLSDDNIIYPASGGTVTAGHYTQGTAYANSATHDDARPVGGILSTSDPDFQAGSTVLFHPDAGSPALNGANDGSDIGAVQDGVWTFDDVGVTWTATERYRAPLPAAVDASLVGLA